MEINLSRNAGVRPETLGANVNNVAGEATETSRAVRPAANLAVTTRAEGLAAAEPTAEVPEQELRRDDALGALVGAAFNLPPPPPPDFS